MRAINDIIIHCAYTKPSMDIGVAEIRAWHLDRGWRDIGYTYVIRRNGLVEKGRDLDNDGDVDEEIGAHALGHNAHSLGICLVGGMSDEGVPDSNFTLNQLVSLKNLVETLQDRYPDTELHGHRDYSSKACPCFDANALFG
jgi:N-acetylmuramoyl-L-alanine amidase